MIEIIPNLHPVFVHYPIAFTSAAVAFVGAGILFRKRPWAAQCLMTGRWMLWGSALFASVAAMFGWLAFNSVQHDEVSHVAMLLHRNWALSALTALLVLAVWDVWRTRSGKMPSPSFLFFLVAAWLLVTSTAWHGAELVYRHGLGVLSLPEPEKQGEHHEHGAGHDGMPTHGKAIPDEGSQGDMVIGADKPHKQTGHTHPPGTATHSD